MKWFSWGSKHTEQQQDTSRRQQIKEMQLANYRKQNAIQEAIYSVAGNLVDRCEDLIDPETGEKWDIISDTSTHNGKTHCMNKQWYDRVRESSRKLLLHNPWAQNIQDNRVSYIVGAGHQYDVNPVSDDPTAIAAADAVRIALDEFRTTNNWENRQQNNQERLDRDGEVFIRIVRQGSTLVLRYIEPEQVYTPSSRSGQSNISMGVQYTAGDVESVEGYWVDGEFVEAKEVQHRKRGVDFGTVRGIALYWSIIKNLSRADKLLRNSSTLSEIQTAIALIRKHTSSSGIAKAFRDDQADASVTNDNTGKTTYVKKYGAGTILDASSSVDYEFPAQSIAADSYKGVQQNELRAAASRVIMPEYMVSADSSNSNYSSTLVSEGPAVKNFERQQAQMIKWDQKLIDMMLDMKVEIDELASNDLELVDITITPPLTQVRDRKADTEADQILVDTGAMSVPTMSERANLDPAKEADRQIKYMDEKMNLVPEGAGEDEDNPIG